MRSSVRSIPILLAALLILGGITSGSLAESRIGISDSQKDQLKALASNTRDRTGREREALRRARMELFQVYSKYDIDEHKAKALRDRVSASQLSLLNIHLDNEIALRNIFSADQFSKFRVLMRKRTRDPEMLVLTPPEEAILERLPDQPMLQALGISSDDQKRLKPEAMKSIKKLQRDSNELLEQYSDYTLDSAAARKLIDSIHDDQVDLLMAQHHRQHVVRDVLSEDQFQKLQQEIVKRMSDRGGRKGPRR